jgi:hypothetical protein
MYEQKETDTKIMLFHKEWSEVYKVQPVSILELIRNKKWSS